jgi:hypothetical protein
MCEVYERLLWRPPNGPRISCGDFLGCAQSYVSLESDAPVSCMRLLDDTELRAALG